jgi:hypothetical protein
MYRRVKIKDAAYEGEGMIIHIYPPCITFLTPLKNT